MLALRLKAGKSKEGKLVLSTTVAPAPFMIWRASSKACMMGAVFSSRKYLMPFLGMPMREPLRPEGSQALT